MQSGGRRGQRRPPDCSRDNAPRSPQATPAETAALLRPVAVGEVRPSRAKRATDALGDCMPAGRIGASAALERMGGWVALRVTPSQRFSIAANASANSCS